MNNVNHKINKKIYVNSYKSRWGFSLIELIVVIAIMAVLLGLLSPAVVQYVQKNKKKACRQNREAILAIYQRCVFDSSIAKSDTDQFGNSILGLTSDKIISFDRAGLGKVIPSIDGTVAFTPVKEEVYQYRLCPLEKKTYNNGEYGVETASNTAWIKCDSCGDIVSIDMVGWKNAGVVGDDDEEIPIPTPTPEPTPVVETPSPSPSPSPTPFVGDPSKDWPYADDITWWDKDQIAANHGDKYEPGNTSLGDTTNNMYITMKAPSGIFYSKAGGQFVYVAENNDQKIYYYQASTPEYYSALHPNWLIQLTGHEIKFEDSDVYNGQIYVVGAMNGDLLKFNLDGKTYTYVYWHSEEKDMYINVSGIKSGYPNKVGNMYRVSSEY